MRFVAVEAYAKLNWSLAVLGKMENGYHELDMLLQSVSLCDKIDIQRADEISLKVNGKETPFAQKNLCVKAANAFFEYTGINKGCDISLTKRIPICAGMGGGSADAAGTLIALNVLYETRLKHEELVDIGMSLGADVPFMLKGGLMRAGGIGERLESKRLGDNIDILVLMPRKGASTPEIFSAFDAITPPKPIDNDALVAALEAGDKTRVAGLMANHLQPVTASLNPGIAIATEALMNCGAMGAMMTGSGSACFGIYPDADSAAKAQQVLVRSRDFKGVYKVHTVHSAVRLCRLLR